MKTTNTTSQRKLAAIMFTDIEGYTALMQKSEEQAILFRNKHREVFQKEVENHQGQILHYYGDGTLSVFDSAVKAVECGVAIQLAMRDEPIIPVRIGVHSGDIVFTDDDIIGDGVNVASRIESLAVPNSIFISDKVFDEIKNHSEISTKYLKSYLLKNVERPVGVYAVTNSGLTVPEVKHISGKIEAERDPVKILRSSGKKIWVPALLLMIALLAVGYWMRGRWESRPVTEVSKVVAVIPFDVGGEEEYFQVGMTQGLIAELSKIDRLQVIDQLTTRYYSGIGVPFINLKEDLPQIDFVILGTASRSSNMLTVIVKLLVSGQEEPIWTKEYSRDISEIRLLWSEVARDLTKPIGVQLNDKQNLLGVGVKPVKPEIYELYLKGTYHLFKENPQDWQTGITYLQQAIDQNPADAFAYAALAEGFNWIGHGPSPSRDVFPKAREAALRAIQLDSTLAQGWAALSHYETYYGWNWERAEQAFEKSNRMNPNLATNHFHRAWYLILLGRKEEAIREHELAEQLDPFSQLHAAGTGLLYGWTGQYEEALKKMDEAMSAPGYEDWSFAQAWKANVLSDMGRHDEAIKLSKEASEKFPIWRWVSYGPALIKSGRIEEAKQIINEIEKAPTALGALSLGFMYALLGDADNAIKWLRHPDKHGWYPWIRVWPGMGLESLYDDPRFLELLKEMNLPNPEKLRPDRELADASLSSTK